MTMKRAGRAALDAWVDTVRATRTVYGVVAKGDRFDYAPVEDARMLRLDFDVTVTPPKKYFLPEREELLTFTGAAYESVLPSSPFVLIGVHPYDMAALNQLDTLFAETNRDAHYFARRDAATIVAVDVETPSQDCFAGSVGYATVETGFDVLLTKIGDDAYLLDARTKKGEDLVASLEAVEADAAALEAREAAHEANRRALRAHEVEPDPAELPAILEAQYDHPIWAEKAKRCFSCGSCNLVCPTCYCFDVQEDVNYDLSSGTRRRTWDGCMLARFALVAGGHNFRGDVVDRFRHRYYRKGKYIPEKIGALACVGCGRCISACVAKIAHPPEIFNTLHEAAKAKA